MAWMADVGLVEFAVFHVAPENAIRRRAALARKVGGLLWQFAGTKVDQKDHAVHTTSALSSAPPYRVVDVRSVY